LPAADVTIAVNRAALRFSCDWWAALDYPTFARCSAEVQGSPALFTAGAVLARLKRCGSPWAERFGYTADRLTCSVRDWTAYTATAALVLAEDLGAVNVDVYGADWTDAPDYDGHRTDDYNRGENRWARERGIWDGVCEWMRGRGVSVERLF